MNPHALQAAALEFNQHGVPVSSQYGDVYHSDQGGLAQARHVFIAGNRLPEAWADQPLFTILETGFGLGLNFLTTWQAWRADPHRPARLHFVSLEKHPFQLDHLRQLHTQWPELAPLAEALQAQWPDLTPGAHRLLLNEGRVTLTLFFGDAQSLVPRLQLRANALFLDGFAPSKNPDLWDAHFLRKLTRCCANNATLATWSVAAGVRKDLQDAGWQWEKRPGFGSKRDMLIARRLPERSPPERHRPPRLTPRRAIVIGAGIAGASCCEALARRGWQVTLLDRAEGPGRGASGNPIGLFHPVVTRDDNYMARLSRAACQYLLRLLAQLGPNLAPSRTPNLTQSPAPGPRLPWAVSGVLQLARDAAQEAEQAAAVTALGFPPSYVQTVSAAEASRLAGAKLSHGGWYYPGAGWVSPAELCQALILAHGERIEARYDCPVARIEPIPPTAADSHEAGNREGNLSPRPAQSAQPAKPTHWRALNAQGDVLAEAPLLIVASAYESAALLPALEAAQALPLSRIRGQVSLVSDQVLPPIAMALCGNGYVTPAHNGCQCFGATYDLENVDLTPTLADHRENLDHLYALLPELAPGPHPSPNPALAPETLAGRASFRTATPDRLPLVGPVPDLKAPLRREAQLGEVPRHGGLHVLCGLGSRGMVWAPLAAELLAARLEEEPLPLERELADALDPARFWLRQRKESKAT